MSASSSSPKLVVKRCPWETKFEWQCRCKFVHDLQETYGTERAISLSMVWSNMNFLGCKYPEKTKALVSDYPVPRKEELKRWLREHNYSDDDRPDTTEGPARVKDRVSLRRPSSELSPPAKIGRVVPPTGPGADGLSAVGDGQSSSEESMPFETLTEQLDFLISSIRRQHEPSSTSTAQEPVSSQTAVSVDVTDDSHSPASCGPAVSQEEWMATDTDSNPLNSRDRLSMIKKLAQKCICSKCNSVGDSYPSQVLLNICSSLKLNMRFDGYVSGEEATVARIYINQVFVSQASSWSKEEAEEQAADELLSAIAAYQETNWKPPCYSSGVWARIGDMPSVRPNNEPDNGQDNCWHKPREKGGRRGFAEPAEAKHGRGRRMMLDGLEPSAQEAVGNGMRERLLEFIHSDKEELVFTADLSPDELQIVNALSEQYLLKHHCYGSTGSRHIIRKRVESLPAPSSSHVTERPTYSSSWGRNHQQ